MKMPGAEKPWRRREGSSVKGAKDVREGGGEVGDVAFGVGGGEGQAQAGRSFGNGRRPDGG